MGKMKNGIFYIGLIGVFSGLMYLIIFHGTQLEQGRNIINTHSHNNIWAEFTNIVEHNLKHPLALLLAQIITIILMARIFGWICKKIGQPSVIGEIVAGIVLGPSLMGAFFPEFSTTLFPVESLGNLQFLSQIGLILFMFVVGMELDLKVLKNKANSAIVVSHASIIIPFSMGLGLAFVIYTSFAPKGVPFTSFGLFLGIAMSITAFPVLARIVQERGMHKTRLGAMVITCAAADDITAWCILAATIAIVKAGSIISSLYTILLAAGYVFAMIKLVRPFLKRIGELHATKENLNKPIVAIFFLTLIISAYATEVIGIHALFGAFMAGTIIPDNAKFRSIFIEKIEDVAIVLLLPLFFVFTGLRTQIGLLNDSYMWEITGVIIIVAVIGKFMGSALAAKFVGQSWKDSLTIGALMNTRGLMELIVLNIGFDLGIITPEIFTMFVIMALVTTFMTGPLLNLIQWAFISASSELKPELILPHSYKILMSFENPDHGKSLLRLANSFVKKLDGNNAITAIYLSSSNELHHFNIDDYESESFAPIIQESQKLNLEIATFFKASNNIDADIVEVANEGDYDLLLVGAGWSILGGNLLGKILGFTTRIINPNRLLHQVTGKENLFENTPFDEKTRFILSKCNIPVGVLIDNGLYAVDNVIIPVYSEADIFLFKYAQKLLVNSDSVITIFDATGEIQKQKHMKAFIGLTEQNNHQQFVWLNNEVLTKELFKHQNLMLISIDSWKKLVESKSVLLPVFPSTLIMLEKP